MNIISEVESLLKNDKYDETISLIKQFSLVLQFNAKRELSEICSKKAFRLYQDKKDIKIVIKLLKTSLTLNKYNYHVNELLGDIYLNSVTDKLEKDKKIERLIESQKYYNEANYALYEIKRIQKNAIDIDKKLDRIREKNTIVRRQLEKLFNVREDDTKALKRSKKQFNNKKNNSVNELQIDDLNELINNLIKTNPKSSDYVSPSLKLVSLYIRDNNYIEAFNTLKPLYNRYKTNINVICYLITFYIITDNLYHAFYLINLHGQDFVKMKDYNDKYFRKALFYIRHELGHKNRKPQIPFEIQVSEESINSEEVKEYFKEKVFRIKKEKDVIS